MTFPQKEFFNKYPLLLDSEIKNSLFHFCAQIDDFLHPLGIKKFTVVLSEDKNIDVTIPNDVNRRFQELGTIETIYGKVEIFYTKINNVNYSDIPIIFIDGNKLFTFHIEHIKQKVSKFFPEKYIVGNHSGNNYLIYSKEVTGRLWNIHKDAFDYKAHLVLTDCNQNFVWYKDKLVFKEKLEKDNFYIFKVNYFHTVEVSDYGCDGIRLHLVLDLISQDQQTPQS